VLPDTVPRAWLGGAAGDFADLWARWDASERTAAVVGVAYDSSVTFTPPFVRDKNDKAVTNGRLVVTRYLLSMADTGGLDGFVHGGQQPVHVLTFNGRIVGHSGNLVGFAPISTTVLSVSAGRANTAHAIRIKSRLWLPMTLTALEWAGQLFLNSRRV